MAPTPFKLLYVCDRNDARSPLAERITRRLVSGDESGAVWDIGSAGTSATEGIGARIEALRAARELDLDLADHSSRQLDPSACLDYDLVLGMEWEQVSNLWSLVPEAWDTIFTVKEFVHWAKQAPARPHILFSDRVEQMRDRIDQANTLRKRARADHGFWGGLRPADLNLIEPHGHGDDAWATLAEATRALVTDVITLLATRKV